MQTISSGPEPGLRERKKAQTRASLERAAVELTLDRPVDDVTVDEIMLGEGLVDAHGPVPAEAQAELVVVACIGSIRIALREWADAGALDTPRAIAVRATAIARTLAPLAG